MLPEPVLVSDWLGLGVFGNMVISRLSYQNTCLILNECSCVFHALQISKESAEYMVEEYKRLRQRDSTGGLLLKHTSYGWHGNTLSWQHTVMATHCQYHLMESVVELKCKVLDCIIFMSLLQHEKSPLPLVSTLPTTGITKSSWRITVRQLESMIRLSEAMARMHCSEEVRSHDMQCQGSCECHMSHMTFLPRRSSQNM